MARDVRAKALAYLRSGAVTVIYANTFAPPSPRRPFCFQADVRGHRSTYQVQLIDGTWVSTCRCERQDECPHIAAVQIISGHAPAAVLTRT